MEKSIDDSISIPAAGTNAWCESAEEVIDALTEVIYSFNIPRWADQEQSSRVKDHKKKARRIYAKHTRTSGQRGYQNTRMQNAPVGLCPM